MSIVVPNAPRTDPTGRSDDSCGNATSVTYPTKLAPPVTPMVEGDAIVFRITPCKIQPDSDRHTPTSPPQSTRGKRRCQISSRAVESSSTNSARKISGSVKCTVPMPTQISADSALAAPKRAISGTRRRRQIVLLIAPSETPSLPSGTAPVLPRSDAPAIPSASRSAPG